MLFYEVSLVLHHRIKELRMYRILIILFSFHPLLSSGQSDFIKRSNEKEFKIENNRLFVMYTTDLGWASESYAYEIDLDAKGNKVIINEY